MFINIHEHHQIKKQLTDTVKSGRISHAQLFFGPEGNNKLALAWAYAKYICCLNRADDDSCNVCSSCIKFNNFAHPDLHFVFPVNKTAKIKADKPTSADFHEEWRQLMLEKNCSFSLQEWYDKIGLENKQGLINTQECEDIIKTLSLKSYESEYKIMIIWMAERLYHSAAHKLLKILEEPPDKTLFILVSEYPDMLLATIRSRTQLIKIPRYTNDDIKNFLQKKYIDAKRIQNIVKLSNGNIIKAEVLTTEQQLNDNSFEDFQQLMRLSFEFTAQKIHEFVKEIAGIGREKQRLFLEYGLVILRESLLYNTGQHQLLKLQDNEITWIKKFAPYIHHKNIIPLQQCFTEAIYHIERNGMAKLIFADLIISCNKWLKAKV